MADTLFRSEEAASETVESIHFSFYTSEEARKISVKEITSAELFDTRGSIFPGGLYDLALGPVKPADPCKSCGQDSVHCPGHYGHIELAMPIYNPLLFHSLKGLLQITCLYCHKFRMGQEKVGRYVSILALIIQGDVVAAKNLATSLWDEAVFGSDDSRQHVKLNANVNYSEERWTSIQHAEATSTLFEIMRERPKKCGYCQKMSPKLECHTFGWLEKSQKISEIRSNAIEDYTFGPSKGGKQSNLGSDDEVLENENILSSRCIEKASEGNGELLEPEKPAMVTNNQSRDVPPKIINLLSSRKIDMLPTEVEDILKDLWAKEFKLCMLICDIQCRSLSKYKRKIGYDMFFLKVLLVTPNKFRPQAISGEQVVDHPQNVLLINVVDSNISLAKAKTSHQYILQEWRGLQNSVNLLFDSSKGFGKSGKPPPNGIRQLLDKKDGMLRQKMMGKRVNFACRSVISPDPYLAVHEIGIPPYFALRLTYPERVTPWNVHKLRQAVLNGAFFHPGATHYKDRDNKYSLQDPKKHMLTTARGMRDAISRKLRSSRAISKVGLGPETKFEGKLVYRHLKDGDIVLVNRQPTLHKPSMMAHVVRILKGEKTIRMHYANCSTYNADFDGDEMNVHFPQDEISRAELVHIVVNANKQYIVPTSGDPIRGLIQISTLVAADEVQSVPPAIWKPKPLWTGKQVITAILHHVTKGQSPLTVEKEGRIPKEYFGKDATERKLLIYNNEIIHGVIDKAQFGKCGLIHTVHELYGSDAAGQLLSVFSHLFTFFLQMHGFTCGVDDLLVFQKSDSRRNAILGKSEKQSEEVHRRFTATKEDDFKDPLKLLKETEKVIRRNGESATTRLDRMMSNALNVLTSEVNKALFPAGLKKPFPKNCLSLMTSSGAKGGLVNMTQISSVLGQQELEGKRVPRMASGKTLPCFPAWDVTSRAGGFISDRFLTGLRPQEYFFHCMAGREGLVDTAVKTSRSGYLQRCLVKNLECLKVCYDYTVRDADGSIIQFTYGEDGVDVQKSSFLGEFEILAMNQKVVLEKHGDQLDYAHLSKSNGYIKDLPNELKEKATCFFTQLSNNPSGLQVKGKNLMNLVKLKYLSSLAEPGEGVGVIAAQSIGEPSTQMTLNTFHLAGRGEMNVTLGIPRLTEILMNAKVDISTPVMTCPLYDWRTRADAEVIASELGRICLADVIERLEVCVVPFCTIEKQVYTVYKLTIKLYSPDRYPLHSGINVEVCMNTLQTTFIKGLEEDISKHLVLLSKIIDIKTSLVKKVGDLADGDLDEPEGKIAANEDKDDDDDGNVVFGDAVETRGDDDANETYVDGDDLEDLGADAEKWKRQATDEIEYDDDFEFEEERSGLDEEADEMQSEHGNVEYPIETIADYKTGEGLDSKMEQEISQTIARTDSNTLTVPSKKEKSGDNGKTVLIKKLWQKGGRIPGTNVKGLEFEVYIKFGIEEPHVLLAELAQKTAKRVYVKSCWNIDRCTVVEPKRSGEPILLQTAGVNFKALWNLYDYIDVNKIVTNNIHAMLITYGVEAARATILNEVKGVFDAYGIRVNIRHLMLIADLMTANGDYRSLNRIGMRKSSTSPFGKMSFEVATNVVTNSALRGEVDTMDSPSACVSLGKVAKIGTGVFDLLQNIQL
ncbi:hypothetical protein HPP92_015356 [Vanilla planifolia]|uniref:DNA-directed RNA polymerase subunit n=1 Tax=Vanilla planifolia TaxID=51239 RepID=A0A835URZ1_VANPL|nr:hypothetical protein HPP92_015356 [Vanilla planifolia]